MDRLFVGIDVDTSTLVQRNMMDGGQLIGHKQMFLVVLESEFGHVGAPPQVTAHIQVNGLPLLLLLLLLLLLFHANPTEAATFPRATC
jgi:hypothetical protein